MQSGSLTFPSMQPRRTQSLSIRTSLVLALVLSVLLPAIIINILTRNRGIQDGIQQTTHQLESVVILKSAQINIWIEDLQRELSTVIGDTNAMSLVQWVLPDSDIPSLRSDSVNRLAEIFSATLLRTDRFEELFLIGLNGEILVSTQPDSMGTDLSQLEFFGQETYQADIEPLAYDPEADRITLTILRPVQTLDGDVIAALGGRVPLTRLDRIMSERTGMGNTGETYLIDSNGILLTESRYAGYEPGETRIGTEAATATASKQNGEGIYPNYRDQAVVGVYDWLPELGVGLVAEQSRAEALAPTYRTIEINILGTVISVVVVVIAGLWFVRGRITQPLAQLSHTSREIASGNLNVRTNITQDNEIGILARSLDTMTERLQSTINDLQSHIQQLEVAEQAKGEAETERARLQQEVIDAQREAIRELSTPVIPITDHILIMPVVGTIDTIRARDIMRALLAGITKYQAHVVILDITGVTAVDTQVASYLNQSVQAAKLKGAKTIITGISDAVAETLVDLGIDWRDIETLRDLRDGLSAAFTKVENGTDTLFHQYLTSTRQVTGSLNGK